MSWKRLAASLTFAAVLGLAGCGAAVDRRASLGETRAQAEHPPEGRFVTVNGARVHVVVAGQGPDLVLIHGASGNTRDFTFSFADQVKDRYRVLVFDRPGLGYTDHADPRFAGSYSSAAESPAVQARMLQAAAAQLGATKPIVLGHSYGGAVALAWALERPETLSALVIVSGATEPWPGSSSLGPLYDIAASKIGGAAAVPLLTAFPPRQLIRSSLATIFAPAAGARGLCRAYRHRPDPAPRRDALQRAAGQRPAATPGRDVAALRRDRRADGDRARSGGRRSCRTTSMPNAWWAGYRTPRSRNCRASATCRITSAPQKVVDAIDRAAARARLR